ncbi:ABC transporter ATP-binding protein [Limobrevibacterium gyesilva]|uniref:ABC transporter ATP-binding protein n=1 Tax=Limobrevibacterium gyesilva TaxID=2991712 RepID=A0AA41YJB1_9PROT|nr:ABC transporter ATP-binding protein [Limobrevibacterium gyesilva]MCW3473291.1 ABC transporter ATP-binding protein [Limobrevibacterium gyesilva]
MSAGPLLNIEDLSVALPEGADRRFAVQGVSLPLGRREVLCVVGESGSGKSVLANTVMGLLPAPALRVAGGRIMFDGQELTRLPEESYRELRGRRISMIFQEPMTALNPVLTIGEQIEEVLAAHGMADRRTRRERALELLAAMHLPDPPSLLGAYPFRLSGGQRQRVMIAAALALEPEILIADEPTTALDVTTQKQILRLIREIQERRRLSVLFITHDFGVVADIADKVAVMQHGSLVEYGVAAKVLDAPEHPYTQRLIAAVRRLEDGAEDARPVAAAEPLLEIKGLRKTYRSASGFFGLRKREVRAVDDVTLTIHQGETVGLVGESGSGKTTLGQLVVRLLPADGGELAFRGQEIRTARGARLLGLRKSIQMVFQDPFASLNPRHRVGRILTETPIRHGVTPAQAATRARELLHLVGLDVGAYDRFPHEFSGGQRQRIAIARALALDPELVVADEPVSALDVSVQAQVLELLADLRRRLNLSMLFITHDLRVASRICDRIAVMRGGVIVEIGSTRQIFGDPQHEYTRGLLDSIPGRSWLGIGGGAPVADRATMTL